MASSACIYDISFADLSIKGAGFALYKVTWANIPLGTQTVLVQYRVQGDVTWINVSTNLQIDASGNLIGGELIILTPAVAGEYYEVRLVNQCGSLEYIQTFYYQSGVNSGYYLLDNGIYNICGNDPVPLFSNIPFAIGAIMYTDPGLTTVKTGFSLIANPENGIIYALNSGTGVVGASTGFGCNDTYTTLGKLANSTGATCSAVITYLYSDEIPVVSTILYTDVALTIAATGFDYVLFINDGVIYNLNNVTGAITAVNVAVCSASANLYQYAPVLNDVGLAAPTQLYTPGSFGRGAIMYTDSAMTTELTGQNFIAEQFSSIIYSIDDTTGLVGCIAVEC